MPEETESAAHRRVRRTAQAHVAKVAFAVKVLRIPAILVGLPAIPALLVATGIAATAHGWWRIALLVLCLAGWVAVALWWIRVKRYRDAIRDQDELAAQFTAAFALFDSGSEVLARMLAVVERGGIRVVYRLRSLWRVVRIPDYVTSQVEDLNAARWFIPPMPATTALRFTILLWTTGISWVGMLVLIVLRLTGVA